MAVALPLKISANDQNRSTLIDGIVEWVGSCEFGSIVSENVGFETIKRDALQKPGWNNPVGINIVTRQVKCPVRNRYNFERHNRSPLRFDWDAGLHTPQRVRMSVTSPLAAAITTISGDINRVRPVGLP